MPYSSEGYERRADECVRLANLTTDEIVQRELLLLRQTYLQSAAKLRRLSGNSSGSGARN